MKAATLLCLSLLTAPLMAQTDTCPLLQTIHSEERGFQTVTICKGQGLKIVNDIQTCDFTFDSPQPIAYQKPDGSVMLTKGIRDLSCDSAKSFLLYNPPDSPAHEVDLYWHPHGADGHDKPEYSEVEPEPQPTAERRDAERPQVFALKAGHFIHILNTRNALSFHVTTDFPVTIRERGCLQQNVMDDTFHCKSGSDIYIYDERPILSFGAEPNAVSINWDAQ